MENDQNQGVLGGSILDKIISSKEDKAKQDFNPQEVVVNLLKKLAAKEAEVLKYRFGLSGYNKETLEAIGKRYEVTRERIRQIENLAIKKIKDSSDFQENIKPVEQVLSSVLEEHGGIMSEEFLLEQLFVSGAKQGESVRSILFIISKLLDKNFVKLTGNKKFQASWKTKLTSTDFLEKVIEEVKKILDIEKKPLSLEEILSKLEDTDFYQANSSKIDEKVLEAYLGVSLEIDQNPFEEYGLSSWGSVKPKRMNDKIRLLLNKEKKPMHFVVIAEKLTQIFKKRAYPPTVHNELILNKEYVLVGRGIYALKEWGYKKGVVADIIEDILRDQGPLTRKEIVEKVLEQRIVKKNTIHLALTNKEKFKKLEDGKYSLVEEK